MLVDGFCHLVIQDPPEIKTESDELGSLGCIKARVWSRNVCFALFRADFTPWTWLQAMLQPGL